MFIGTPEEIINFLQDKKPDKKYKILEYRKKRTIKQNSYFHLIIWAISKEFMIDFNQLKSFYKLEYLKSYKDWLPYIKGTSELTTTEIKTFIEQIRIHAAEFFNFEIPDPETKQFNLFCEYYENINNNF